MKIITTLLLLLCFNVTQAQHCKFDGQNVLVIKLENQKGEPKTMGGYSIKIIRAFTNNIFFEDTVNGCCKLKRELTFDTCSKVLLNTDDAIWNSYATVYKNLPLFKYKGCYAIILSDDEIKCLMDKCVDEKKLYLQYTYKKHATKRFVYPTLKNIYPLCSSFGKWASIKPVIIKLPNKEVFYGH
jgi:hypothetical protein